MLWNPIPLIVFIPEISLFNAQDFFPVTAGFYQKKAQKSEYNHKY